MRALVFPLLFLLTAAIAPPADLDRLKSEAAKVTIVRDDWGIAHVSGPTDADAVFGMIYAQAEDDFPRIEANYLTALGRTAEADGEKAIWQDLRARLYVSDAKLKDEYARSPEWLKKLMNAWADGLNYYLASHPDVHPKVITRFEPWMALSFTEGSIGGDIESIDLGELEKLYANRHPGLEPGPALSLKTENRRVPGQAGDDMLRAAEAEHQNSNGIAIAPKITADGHALLLINPHTGWMHTSTGADSIDEFAYDVRQPELGPRYRFGNEWRPMEEKPVTIRYRKPDGSFGTRTFTTYFTHRGPIVRSENGKWIAFAIMDRPIRALEQSYLRTKTSDLASYLKVADMKANSSNNTLFADDKGNIAYLHPQFVPIRDDRFDYTRPVDGSDPATDWKGDTPIGRLPNAINPPNGWVDNNNNAPWSTAGSYSPKPNDFPKYMDQFGENFRGLHALRMLTGSSGWTADKLNAAAFDSYQPGFAALIPPLLEAYCALPAADPRKANLAGPVAALRAWDYRWGANSVQQSLAMFYGRKLYARLKAEPGEVTNRKYMRLARDTSAEDKVDALSDAVDWLQRDFGKWQVPWGEINRFQRSSPAIDHPFDDKAPSVPVPFADGNFGSLASFKSDQRPGTKKWYGYHGNSFVAIVEFGPKVSARAVKVGGESGHAGSRHFTDQIPRYASGALREVYFWPEQLRGHTERTYHPGE